MPLYHEGFNEDGSRNREKDWIEITEIHNYKLIVQKGLELRCPAKIQEYFDSYAPVV